jgi:putative transcriptional regulator
MIPRHHPEESLLVTYASGELQEPLSLVVATHLALCPACRHGVAQYEALGGLLLEDLPPAPLNADGLRISDVSQQHLEAGEAVRPSRSLDSMGLPEPLNTYLANRAGGANWRKRHRLSEISLLTDYPGFRTKLIKIAAGTAMPRHTHEGHEFTLVLAGGFADATGQYQRGDVAVADSMIDHQPIADSSQDCICLAVVDAPLRLTGFPGRFMNFLVRAW